MTRAYCITCRRHVRGLLVEHHATVTHRQTARRAEFRTDRLPKGRPTWMTALRDWADQYAADDPGNSPEWDAAWRTA